MLSVLVLFGKIAAAGTVFALAASNFDVFQTAITLFGVVAAFSNVALNTIIIFHNVPLRYIMSVFYESIPLLLTYFFICVKILKKENIMKVVLLKDVKGSGKAGDVIEAKTGYAQNYLIKNGLAKVADASALNENKAQKAAAEYHREQTLKQNKELREKLDGKEITLQMKSGGTGKFFGAVTGKEIADKLYEMGFDIDKKKIQLSPNIKVAGRYPVSIRISAEETAKITVNIIN